MPSFTDSRYSNSKDLFIEEDLPREVFILVAAPEQATMCLDSSSYASKAVKQHPEKPSRSEAATSDQMDSNNTYPKEKISLLTVVS